MRSATITVEIENSEMRKRHVRCANCKCLKSFLLEKSSRVEQLVSEDEEVENERRQRQ